MIPDGGEALRNSLKQLVSIVDHFARLPMDRRNLRYRAAEQAGDPLMPQANPKHRHFRVQYHIAGDAKVALAVGPSRSRRNDDAVEVKTANLFPSHRVVADDDWHLARNRSHGMYEVKCKRIVVIDD